MEIRILDDAPAMSRAAAAHAAAALRRVVAERGRARVVVATAASQLAFQHELVSLPGVPWADVEVFQLDEYIGLSADHPASFRRLLLDNVVRPAGVADVHLIDGADPDGTRAAMKRLLATRELDLAFLGIGENAHLAFNDPPADFATTDPYLVVDLDEACRQQQVGEGWFARLADVPARAVTMSVHEMLRAREILVIVPDSRKADAVRATLESPVSPSVPASILRTHPHVTLFLDRAAAARLDPRHRPATGEAG